MTDRVKGLMVSLMKDIRVDDVQKVIDAIKMVRGVGDVDFVIADHEDWMNRTRIRHELSDKIMDVLHPKLKEAREKATLT